MSSFNYKGNIYYSGTIIKIYNDKANKFNFNKYLQFSEFDNIKNKYKFYTLYDCWTIFYLSKEELEVYIESVINTQSSDDSDIVELKLKDIDNIVPVLTWFILILIGSLFINGIINKIFIQIIAVCFFTIWIKNKKKGR